MATARSSSPDRILRPRPIRALPEALRAAGPGLTVNGYADVPSGLSRYAIYASLSLDTHLTTVAARLPYLKMRRLQFNHFQRPGKPRVLKLSTGYSTQSTMCHESPTSTLEASTAIFEASLSSSGSA